jgi:acetoin utilization deacetylase AcuC-like enzyme
MLPFRLVYHPGYNLELGEHVVPGTKYGLIRSRLLGEGLACPEDFVEPEPATDAQLLSVHTREWIDKLKTGSLTHREILTLELPYSTQLAEAFRLSAGGTLLAGRLALRDGVAYNIGGGFHHAFPDHGEGFCAINDVAVAIRCLQREAAIKTAMIVDCDVHHGSGTAAIFAQDQSVLTLSIHQLNNYPPYKPPSSIDIQLGDGAGDCEYNSRLRAGLRLALLGFQPDLLFYLAGADPYYRDQLGGLNLTSDGLWERDSLVMEAALDHAAPVAICVAGGYAFCIEDTVTIHANTARVAKESVERIGWYRYEAL